MLTSNIILKIVKIFMNKIVKSFKINDGEICQLKLKRMTIFVWTIQNWMKPWFQKDERHILGGKGSEKTKMIKITYALC